MQYLHHCFDKYQLSTHIQLRSNVNRMAWNEAEAIWEIDTADGRKFRTRVVISGTGPITKPNIPGFPGRALFAKPSFHTSYWDHSVDLCGKKVAVVGTGASAIQVIPTIAGEVKSLKIFQRTPPWVIFRLDHRIPGWVRNLFKAFPIMQKLVREFWYWLLEAVAIGFVKRPGLLKGAQKIAIHNIRKHIKNPILIKKLTPDYILGCKWVLNSHNYYQAIARENVQLITKAIASFDANGIQTKDGQSHNFDVIVYATGFQASENMAPFEIRGKGGIDLRDIWKEGGEAYLGTTVASFPNSFILMGPNTVLGHNLVIHIMESQMSFILDALKIMDKQNLRSIEVKQAAQDRFNEVVQERLQHTVWQTGGCKSWYQNQAGKNTTLWPGFTFEFRRMTRRINPDHFLMEKA